MTDSNLEDFLLDIRELYMSYYFNNSEGIITEEYRDIRGTLEKIGPNIFFGWDISATVDGTCYKLDTLSQVQAIYK